MQKYKIPNKNKDLRRYAVWRNLKYVLGFVTYVALMAAAFLFFLNGRNEDLDPLHWCVYIIYPAVVLVSGWFIFRMTRFFTDKSFSGKIESMSFSRDFGRGINRRGRFSFDYHTYRTVVVRDGKGRKRRARVTLFDDGYDGYFKEGRTLVNYRGLNYPVCLESEDEGAHICTVCGVRTYYKEGKMKDGESVPETVDGLMICRACGHTLINFESYGDKK